MVRVKRYDFDTARSIDRPLQGIVEKAHSRGWIIINISIVATPADEGDATYHVFVTATDEVERYRGVT